MDLRTTEILDSITDGFAAFDPEWRFVFVNKAAERFLQASREQVLGKNHWELFPDTLGTIVEENYRGAMQDRVPREFEFYYESWQRWFSIKCNPFPGGGLTNYFSDITEKKLAAEQLQNRNDALETANRLLEEFAHVSSHDLQEPLRNITLSAQLLLHECPKLDPEVQQHVKDISSGVQRMQLMVSDLLAYVRSTYVDDEVCGVADLADCYRQAAADLRRQIKETGAVTHVGHLPVVEGDPRQIIHIFQNLLSNSLKYRKPDLAPEIHINARPTGDFWTITFRDNGVGFEPEHAKNIFGLFKRLDNKRDVSGTGLGLAICSRIAERFGGNIWAEGFPGQGATFHLTLRKAND